MQAIFEQLRQGRVYDLGQPYYAGMPHHPSHPPYLFGLTKQHGDYVLKNGASSASETITLGGHVGTHLDALCHFSCGGELFGGVPVEGNQSPVAGFAQHAVDTVAPMVRRGVLLDVAGHFHLDALPADFSITPDQLDEIERHAQLTIGRGDVVLLRTGWARYWRDPHQFITASTGRHVSGPGPEEPAAHWLSARGVFACGSDTVAFEKVPTPTMPVHVHLLVEKGIHIIECLNLESLAADGVREFLFVAAPLKITGGTGSPLRPIAIAAQ
jgi:kynurenine formamidase